MSPHAHARAPAWRPSPSFRLFVSLLCCHVRRISFPCSRPSPAPPGHTGRACSHDRTCRRGDRRRIRPRCPADPRHRRHHRRSGSLGWQRHRLSGWRAAHRRDSGLGPRSGGPGSRRTAGLGAGVLDSQRADGQRPLAAAAGAGAGVAERLAGGRCHRHHPRHRHPGRNGLLPLAGTATGPARHTHRRHASCHCTERGRPGQPVRCLPFCAGSPCSRHRRGIRAVCRQNPASRRRVQGTCQPDRRFRPALRRSGGVAGRRCATLGCPRSPGGRHRLAGAVCRS